MTQLNHRLDVDQSTLHFDLPSMGLPPPGPDRGFAQQTDHHPVDYQCGTAQKIVGILDFETANGGEQKKFSVNRDNRRSEQPWTQPAGNRNQHYRQHEEDKRGFFAKR